MILVRRAPPAEMAVSLATLKAHLRREADETIEDALLAGYLAAAIDHLDGRCGHLGRCMVDQDWSAYADAPARLACGRQGFRVELGPIRDLATVTLHALRGGSWTDLDPGLYRVEREPLEEASVVPAPGASWLPADPVRNAWRVDFKAGFGEPEAVPAALLAAILLLAADLDGDRSGKTLASLVANPTVERLISSYRKVTL